MDVIEIRSEFTDIIAGLINFQLAFYVCALRHRTIFFSVGKVFWKLMCSPLHFIIWWSRKWVLLIRFSVMHRLLKTWFTISLQLYCSFLLMCLWIWLSVPPFSLDGCLCDFSIMAVSQPTLGYDSDLSDHTCHKEMSLISQKALYSFLSSSTPKSGGIRLQCTDCKSFIFGMFTFLLWRGISQSPSHMFELHLHWAEVKWFW